MGIPLAVILQIELTNHSNPTVLSVYGQKISYHPDLYCTSVLKTFFRVCVFECTRQFLIFKDIQSRVGGWKKMKKNL